jgi:ABC-type multidrug transport system ATPase subunit
MDQVEAICDRVGIMHDGELVAVGTVPTLRQEALDGATEAERVTLEQVFRALTGGER